MVMASRRLTDLQPAAYERAQQLLRDAEGVDFDVLFYCTLRPLDEQARLFRQGRSLLDIREKADELEKVWQRPDLAELLMNVGPQSESSVVTWAGPGQSLHNYGLALDGVPLRHGKPVWGSSTPDDAALWDRYGKLGQAVGFEWAGTWPKRKREFPHLQEPGMKWQELIAA